MSNAINKVKRAFELFKEGNDAFNRADRLLSSGPSSYYFKKMEGYIDALFDKFAPFKVGDRVRIVKIPNTDNGWRNCRHFLIMGAVGTVNDVDYRDGSFTADVIWDGETWIDKDGNEEEVSNKHTFLMWESQIEKIKDEKCPCCGIEISTDKPES